MSADPKRPGRALLITGEARRHRFFISEALRVFGERLVGAVVQESGAAVGAAAPGDGGLAHKLARGVLMPWRVAQWAAAIVRERRNAVAAARLQEAFYPEANLYWEEGMFPVLRTRDIHDEAVAAFVRACAPTVVLVFGGRILGKSILEACPQIFNVHYGIVPWYRCAGSTTWALARADVRNVGGTVHRVDPGIDSGAVVEYFYPELEAGDSVEQIVEKVRRLGVERLIQTGRRCLDGEPVQASAQGGSGTTYYSSMLTAGVVDLARSNLRRGLVADYTARCATGRSPRRRLPWPRRLAPGVYVMLYHAITGPRQGHFMEEKVGTPWTRFAEHLEFYRQRFEVLSLPEAVGLLERRGGVLREPYVVLSFDDGYRSVLRRAVPLLDAWRLPATIFVSDDCAAGRAGHWRLRLSLLLSERPEAAAALGRSFGLGEATRLEVFDYTKNHFSEHVAHVVNELWSSSGLGTRDVECYLSYEELRGLAEDRYTIGSHTLSHPVLAALSLTEARREIVNGHRAVEAALGRSCHFFSYPFGNVRHWLPEHELIVQQLGQVMAVTANGGVNRWLYPLHIRRIGVTSESIENLQRLLEDEGRALG